MCLDVIEYKGKKYKRYSSKWSDEKNFVVHETLQRELNYEYVKTLNLASMSAQELISQGDKFKESATYQLAVRYYEEASVKCEIKDMAYILPRITSCYRKSNQASKAIEMFSYAKQKFGTAILTAPLLTSAAAAYCDLGEYDNAKKCCDRAYAMSGATADDELRLVYKRIDKETGYTKK